MSEGVGQGFGRMLAEAREAKGWSVAEVGDKLKLTSRQIEALEAEDFSALPAAVFVRGFARNYARLLGLPADNLPGISEPAAERVAAIAAPSEDLVFGTSSVRRWLLLPIAGLILFLVLVAALYNWLRQGEDAYLSNEVQSQVVTAPLPPVTPVPATPAQAAPAQTAQPATVIENVPLQLPAQPQPATPPAATAPAATAPADGAAVATPPAVALPAPAVPAKPQPASPVKPEGDSGAGPGHTVHLTVQDEEAWIDIVSADQKHISRLLRAGEQLTVQGVSPVKLVVGNAAHVRLNYDEKPVDLHPYIGEKVARLTLE